MDLILTNSLFTKCVPVIIESLVPAFNGTSLKMIKKNVLTKPTTTLTGILREKTIHDVFLDLISNQVSRHAKEPRAKKLKWTFWVLFSPKGNSLWQTETLMQSFRSFTAEITSVQTSKWSILFPEASE